MDPVRPPDRRAGHSRRLRSAWICCLLVAVLASGWSATLAQLLGPRHVHRPPTAAGVAASAQQVVAWLREVPALAELRRLRERSQALAHAELHLAEAAHGGLTRHHHAPSDDSVLAIDPVPSDDAGSGSPSLEPAGAAWAFSTGQPAWLIAGLSDARPPARTRPIPNPAPGRLERPPKG